ncbi:MAG: hypothetical protein ACR2MP_16790 [Streptosporangiaceae bacterium]
MIADRRCDDALGYLRRSLEIRRSLGELDLAGLDASEGDSSAE